MEWLIISGAGSVAVALAVGLGLMIRRPHQEPVVDHGRYPYRIQPSVMSASERALFGVLQRALGDTYEVLGKVRVAEVIAPRNDLTQTAWKDAFERISQMHFDFVLCHKDNLQPAAVVELENRAEGNRNLSESRFINLAAHAAHLTVVRFEEKGGYSVNAVRGKILRALDAPVMELTERLEPA